MTRNKSHFQSSVVNTFELCEGALLLHLLPRSLLHALVKQWHHGRLKDQDLHAVDKLRLLLPHKVHHRVHHGVRHVRRTDPSLT